VTGKSKKMKDEVVENPYNRRSENIKQKAFSWREFMGDKFIKKAI
jgi:hypothetical protein